MTQEFQKQLEVILATALNIFQVIATFLVAFLVVLWMTLCFWTFRDIQSRTRDIIAQIFATLLVFFFNIPGVLLYILVRPKETQVQTYERSLQEEYMLQDLEEREICATCRVKTQPDFLFCFNCRTRIRRECGGCGQLVKLKWASCPFCGTPQKTRLREEQRAAPGGNLAGVGALRSPRPSQPATTTALAVNDGGMPNPYPSSDQPYYSGPVINSGKVMPQPSHADGGEAYGYTQEPVYTYRPENDYTRNNKGNNPPPNPVSTYNQSLVPDEVAPSINPSVQQPTQRIQLPRNGHYNSSNGYVYEEPPKADNESSTENFTT